MVNSCKKMNANVDKSKTKKWTPISAKKNFFALFWHVNSNFILGSLRSLKSRSLAYLLYKLRDDM